MVKLNKKKKVIDIAMLYNNECGGNVGCVNPCQQPPVNSRILCAIANKITKCS